MEKKVPVSKLLKEGKNLFDRGKDKNSASLGKWGLGGGLKKKKLFHLSERSPLDAQFKKEGGEKSRDNSSDSRKALLE